MIFTFFIGLFPRFFCLSSLDLISEQNIILILNALARFNMTTSQRERIVDKQKKIRWNYKNKYKIKKNY